MSLLRKDKPKTQTEPVVEHSAPVDRNIVVDFKGTAAVYHVTLQSGLDFQFLPGPNEVKESDWQFMQLNPYFKRDIEAGLFEISQGEPEQ